MLDCKWLAYNTPAPHPNDTPSIINQKIHHAKQELATEWGDCVGQEWAVALAVRKSGAIAAKELLKYAVKGSDLLETLLPIGGLIRAIDAGRTISTFGELRQGKLPPEPDDDKFALACTNCGTQKAFIPIEAMPYISGVTSRSFIHFPKSE